MVKKNNRNFSHARAFLECLVCDGCIVHVTPRTAMAKKPLDANKKRVRVKEQGYEMSAACDALAFTSILFDFHRVLRVLILMRTTCRPRASTTRSCAPTGCRRGRSSNRGGGIIICQDHHCVPTFSTSRHRQRKWKRDSERVRRCGQGRQRREGGERE